MKSISKLFLITLLVLLLTACGNSEITNDVQEPDEVVAPTATYTQAPTNTPAPTETSLPTETPTPTFTPTPVPIVYNQEYLDQFTLKSTVTWNGTQLYDTAWTEDSKWLAIAGTSGLIWVFDVETGEKIAEFENPLRATVVTIEFNPGKTLLAAGNTFGKIAIFDTTSWTLAKEIETGIKTEIQKIVFLENEDLILFSLETEKNYKSSELILWNLPENSLVQSWKQHHDGFIYSSPILIHQVKDDDQITVIWRNWSFENQMLREKFYLTKLDLQSITLKSDRNFDFSTQFHDIFISIEGAIWLIDHMTDGTTEIHDGFSGETIAKLETGGFKGGAIYTYALLSIDGKFFKVILAEGAAFDQTNWDTDTWHIAEPYPDEVFLRRSYWSQWDSWSPDRSMYISTLAEWQGINIFEAP